MLKRTVSVLLILIFTIAFSVTAFAYDTTTLNDIIRSSDVKPTKQFLVMITKPDKNENIFQKSYIICGVPYKSGIRVALAVYNEKLGIYEDLPTIDGESNWDAGNFFTKEVELNKGTNNIKIVAYKSSEASNPKVGENVQVNTFTIIVFTEDFKKKINDNDLTIPEIQENVDKALMNMRR